MIRIDGVPDSAAAARAQAALIWRQDGHHAGRTIAEAIIAHATPGSPGRLILHSERRPVSVAAVDFAADVRRVASGLRKLGVGPGVVVAFQLPGCYEGYLAMVATIACGAVTLPLIPSHGHKELRFILEQTQARILIVPDVWRGSAYPEGLDQLGSLPNLEKVIVLGDVRRSGDIPWSDLETASEGAPLPIVVDSTTPCALLYTSGTTADPKGVVHTHDSLLAALRIEGERPSPALRSPGLGHIGGVLLGLGPLITGAVMVSMERWAADRAACLVEQYGIRTLSGAPVFYRSVLEQAGVAGRNVASIEEVLFGGSAIAPAEIENADRHGVRACRSYGSTEHPLACRTAMSASLEARAHTDGAISPGGRIAILSEEGEILPPGQTGEIGLIGPQQFAGYLDARLNTVQFHPDGWYLTGDIGMLDEQGCLRVTDRKKDIIIRGGENISAREVEALLVGMPGVIEAAVVAMPDDRMGERVCAFIRMQQGAAPDLAQVSRHFVAAGAAKFKIPERIVKVDDFPRTFTGKIQKHVLRARLMPDAQH